MIRSQEQSQRLTTSTSQMSSSLAQQTSKIRSKMKNNVQTSTKNKLLLAVSIITLLLVYQLYEYSLLKNQFKNYQMISELQLNLIKRSTKNINLSLDSLLASSTAPDSVATQDIVSYEFMLASLLQPYAETDCVLKRIGSKNDGGYLVCDNIINSSQVLLNFGIQNDDSFGCEISSQNKIQNYQFDCTVSSFQQCPSQKIVSKFNNVCLGKKDETIQGRVFRSFQSLINEKQLQTKHLIVKMDIEGGEWQSLSAIPSQMFDKIDQLIVQFHVSKGHQPKWKDILLTKMLLVKFGIVNFHLNNFDCYGPLASKHYLPGSSFQVTFVNRELLSPKSNKHSFELHQENKPNNPWSSDCQLQ